MKKFGNTDRFVRKFEEIVLNGEEGVQQRVMAGTKGRVHEFYNDGTIRIYYAWSGGEVVFLHCDNGKPNGKKNADVQDKAIQKAFGILKEFERV